ncbi:hypothetical protein MBH78_17335 [Oceanimonas sp. NS1]|nr:hypothetical protein [Oceanimonas sp. NS1]
MQIATHRWLWNGVFTAIVLMLAGGIYWSSKSIDYNWHWERVLPYIVDTSPQSIRAPFDGRAELGDDGHTLTLISDYGDAP